MSTEVEILRHFTTNPYCSSSETNILNLVALYDNHNIEHVLSVQFWLQNMSNKYDFLAEYFSILGEYATYWCNATPEYINQFEPLEHIP